MAKKPIEPDALESIDEASLQAVTGGRISRTGGPDPATIASIKQLAELISAVGQSITQAQGQGSAQMMQMMQQMMQARGGR